MSQFQSNSSSDRLRHRRNLLLYKEEIRNPTTYHKDRPNYQFQLQMTDGKSQLYSLCTNLKECEGLASISGTVEMTILVTQPISHEDIRQHIPILNTFNSFTYTVHILDHYPSYTIQIKYTFLNNTSSDGFTFYHTQPELAVYSWYNTYCSNVNITSFGGIPLSLEGNQFYSVHHLSISSSAKPTLLPNTTGYQMFYQCSQFSPIQLAWDFSNLTSMERMFYGCTSFNPTLLDWNVYNVTSMSETFLDCTSLNPVSFLLTNINVITMKRMFKGCSSFNTDIRSWNVSSVTDMREMFSGCTSCTLNLSQWNVTANTLHTNFELGSSITIPAVWT